MARLNKKMVSMLLGLVAVLGVGYGVYYAVTGKLHPWEEFDNMAMYQEMGNHDTHNAPALVGQEDMMMHNEEVKKMQEMEEMNALGCPDMLLTGLDPNSLDNQVMTNPGPLKEHMMNSTGLVGAEAKSSIGAEVSGFIGDNRQFPQFPQDQLDSHELLPKEKADMFAQLYPEGQGNLSDRRDFLTSGHQIGINTVGQTLRNANKQLRSDPLVPQQVVSPWLNTTITRDNNRKQFEIGSC